MAIAGHVHGHTLEIERSGREEREREESASISYHMLFFCLSPWKNHHSRVAETISSVQKNRGTV